jgi:hypothetical protein
MNPIWTKKKFGIHKTPVKRTNPPRIRENARVFRAAHPKNIKAHPHRCPPAQCSPSVTAQHALKAERSCVGTIIPTLFKLIIDSAIAMATAAGPAINIARVRWGHSLACVHGEQKSSLQ